MSPPQRRPRRLPRRLNPPHRLSPWFPSRGLRRRHPCASLLPHQPLLLRLHRPLRQAQHSPRATPNRPQVPFPAFRIPIPAPVWPRPAARPQPKNRSSSNRRRRRRFPSRSRRRRCHRRLDRPMRGYRPGPNLRPARPPGEARATRHRPPGRKSHPNLASRGLPEAPAVQADGRLSPRRRQRPPRMKLSGRDRTPVS